MKKQLTYKSKRWKTAQKIEKNFWSEYKKRHITDHDKIIDKQTLKHISKLKQFILTGKDKTILEIGCGPIPLILALPPSKKYALDPLMNYYVSEFKLPKNVKWVTGVGEAMPFSDKYFDAIICVNVLDHVSNPNKVANEIGRICKKDGTLYLTINCVDPIIKLYKRTREHLGFGDKAHPFTFTEKDIISLIGKSGFKITKKYRELSYYGEKKDTPKQKKPLKAIINETIIKILAALKGQTLEEAEYMSYTFIAKKI